MRHCQNYQLLRLIKMKVQEVTENGAGHVPIEQEVPGAQDTIYLCNFRVSVDGDWLCLKELQDVEFNLHDSIHKIMSPPSPEPMSLFGKHAHFNFNSRSKWYGDTEQEYSFQVGILQ